MSAELRRVRWQGMRIGLLREVVLEAEHKHRAYLEGVGVAVDILDNEELVFALVGLRIAYAHAGNPRAFGHERYLLELSLKFLLSRRRKGGAESCQRNYKPYK